MSLKIDWWEIPPYIYKDSKKEVTGIFPKILEKLVKDCCDGGTDKPTCVKLNFSEVPSNDSEVVKKQIDKNGTSPYIFLLTLLLSVSLLLQYFFPFICAFLLCFSFLIKGQISVLITIESRVFN